MKCVRCNTVHYDKPLLPLCVCFHNVILDFTAKTARFARSRAASAQRLVNTIQFVITVLIRVGHTQSTSYISTHTTSRWKWCLLVCMTALVCITRRRIWHHKLVSDNLSDAMCWVWLTGSVSAISAGLGSNIRKREREKGRETQSWALLWSVRLQHCSFTWQLPQPGLDICQSHAPRHSNKDLRASKNTRRDTNTQTWAETVRGVPSLHEHNISPSWGACLRSLKCY